MNRSMSRMITEDEIRTFQEDGIVCLRGVLDEDWVNHLREVLNEQPASH